MHRQTTGPEILQAMEGLKLDWFVCAYGTGGTIKGVGQVLKDKSPHTKARGTPSVAGCGEDRVEARG